MGCCILRHGLTTTLCCSIFGAETAFEYMYSEKKCRETLCTYGPSLPNQTDIPAVQFIDCGWNTRRSKGRVVSVTFIRQNGE